MANDIQPLIYFASIANSGSDKLSFAEIDDSVDDYFIVGFFTETAIEGKLITIVWFDFGKECFHRYERVVGTGLDGAAISFMIGVEGVICVWFTINNQTMVDTMFDCEIIELSNIPDDWGKNLRDRREKYNRHRKELSREAQAYHSVIKAMMKKYTYKLVPMAGGDKEMDLSVIRISLSDGTIASLNETSWNDFHHAAKPAKLSLTFRIESSDYYVSIWLNGCDMIDIFNRFYYSHPETKSDFIIWMDAENNKYELGLYRQGLREPVVIPESAYQLIVFKNKFEDYRSENYNQPRGAWIW